jgi:hypothetical protein
MTALSTSRSVRLLPRFLYVLVWLPRIPIPILVFIPTLVLEGLAYLAEALARRWSREVGYSLEQVRTGLGLIRHQGPFTLVEVELREVGPRALVRLKIGQC